MNKITGTEIKNNVKRKCSFNKLDKDFTNILIDEVISLYQEEIIKALKEEKMVEIRNFMTFYVMKSKRRNFINPKTLEKLTIEPRNYIKVRPGKLFFKNKE